jgi:branched-subunit amino acid ABC-type transport system permease component
VDTSLLKPVLVLGVVESGLYALLPVALVLSYRVSRTIAFVHGGIAASAALIYADLVYRGVIPGSFPHWRPMPSLLCVVAIGAVMGVVYGVVMTHPTILRLPRMTLTIGSVGVMLLLIGIFSSRLVIDPTAIPNNPFGGDTVTIAGVVVTNLRFVTLLVAAILVVALAVLLARTRAGRDIRAIADDLEAASWCGVDVARVGTGVYALSGAVAALAGVLTAATVGPDPGDMIVLLLRSLMVAIVGGLVSLPLALAGALLFALVQTAMTAGMFGTHFVGSIELVQDAVLFAAILLLAQSRRRNVRTMLRQAL